jgi:hypothetical protein
VWGSSFLSGAVRSLSGPLLILPSPNDKLLRETIFSLAIYFSMLPNHDICQVNFGKLLEMLLAIVTSMVSLIIQNILFYLILLIEHIW